MKIFIFSALLICAYSNTYPDVANPLEQTLTEIEREGTHSFTFFRMAMSRLDSEQEWMSNEGEWTLLIPTDDAFRKLPSAEQAKLIDPEFSSQLEQLLKFHVGKGRTKHGWTGMRQVADGLVYDTYPSGLTFIYRGFSQPINGVMPDIDDNPFKARVLEANIMAGRNVIHIIDRVLVPHELEGSFISSRPYETTWIKQVNRNAAVEKQLIESTAGILTLGKELRGENLDETVEKLYRLHFRTIKGSVWESLQTGSTGQYMLQWERDSLSSFNIKKSYNGQFKGMGYLDRAEEIMGKVISELKASYQKTVEDHIPAGLTP